MPDIDPIRIGATFRRTYFFYYPLVSDPDLPDTNNPVPLTDIDVHFVIKIKGTEYVYQESDPEVTVTDLTGRVDILISDEVTALYSKSERAASYLQFNNLDGSIDIRSPLVERVINKEDQ